jgi:hypothetical protein
VLVGKTLPDCRPVVIKIALKRQRPQTDHDENNQ